MTETQIEITPTRYEDIPAIAVAMSQAAVRKAAYGDFLWGDQPYTEDEVAAKVKAGSVYTISSNAEVVGTFSLTNTDERVWEEDGKDPSDAYYIHQLATSDAAKGQGIGSEVIDWVVGLARREGKKSVRLDCSYTNPRLCGYYEGQGFVQVRTRDIPRKSTARDLRDPIYKVALYQRDVQEGVNRLN